MTSATNVIRGAAAALFLSAASLPLVTRAAAPPANSSEALDAPHAASTIPSDIDADPCCEECTFLRESVDWLAVYLGQFANGSLSRNPFTGLHWPSDCSETLPPRDGPAWHAATSPPSRIKSEFDVAVDQPAPPSPLVGGPVSPLQGEHAPGETSGSAIETETDELIDTLTEIMESVGPSVLSGTAFAVDAGSAGGRDGTSEDDRAARREALRRVVAQSPFEPRTAKRQAPMPPTDDHSLRDDVPSHEQDVTLGESETRTGRLMFGTGVNSTAGVFGNLVLEERNFDPVHTEGLSQRSINVLRAAATELEHTANLLEDENLFTEADALRRQAAELRQMARRAIQNGPRR